MCCVRYALGAQGVTYWRTLAEQHVGKFEECREKQVALRLQATPGPGFASPSTFQCVPPQVLGAACAPAYLPAPSCLHPCLQPCLHPCLHPPACIPACTHLPASLPAPTCLRPMLFFSAQKHEHEPVITVCAVASRYRKKSAAVEAVHAVPLAEPIAPAPVGNAVEVGEEADEGEAEPDVDVDVEDNGVRGTADDDFDNFDTDFLQELGAVRSGGQPHCAMTLAHCYPSLSAFATTHPFSRSRSPTLFSLSHTGMFCAQHLYCGCGYSFNAEYAL